MKFRIQKCCDHIPNWKGIPIWHKLLGRKFRYDIDKDCWESIGIAFGYVDANNWFHPIVGNYPYRIYIHELDIHHARKADGCLLDPIPSFVDTIMRVFSPFWRHVWRIKFLGYVSRISERPTITAVQGRKR